jgi:hypothetical protein
MCPPNSHSDTYYAILNVFDRKLTIAKHCSELPAVLTENTSFGHIYLLRGSHYGLLGDYLYIPAASV